MAAPQRTIFLGLRNRNDIAPAAFYTVVSAMVVVMGGLVFVRKGLV